MEERAAQVDFNMTRFNTSLVDNHSNKIWNQQIGSQWDFMTVELKSMWLISYNIIRDSAKQIST